MSRKHAAKSLAIYPDPALRAHLKAIAGRAGSVSDVARRQIEARIAATSAALPVPARGTGKPIRVQLSRDALAAFRAKAIQFSLSEDMLALAILAPDTSAT
jgi:hypothetical protein